MIKKFDVWIYNFTRNLAARCYYASQWQIHSKTFTLKEAATETGSLVSSCSSTSPWFLRFGEGQADPPGQLLPRMEDPSASPRFLRLGEGQADSPGQLKPQKDYTVFCWFKVQYWSMFCILLLYCGWLTNRNKIGFHGNALPSCKHRPVINTV